MVRVCVLGAGIIGLSSATHIQSELPHADVTLIAEKFSPNLTSDVSAGFWMPVSSSMDDNVYTWAKKTYDYLLQMSDTAQCGEMGLQMVYGYATFEDNDNVIRWKDIFDDIRPMRPDEIAKYPPAKGGYFLKTMILECLTYLPYLTKRFLQQGGTIKQRKIEEFSQISDDYDVIVNCTGLGSRDLAKDLSVNPIRGQVFKVDAPWIKTFMDHFDAGAEYVFPGHTLDKVVCRLLSQGPFHWCNGAYFAWVNAPWIKTFVKHKNNRAGSEYIYPATTYVTVGGTYVKDDWNTEITEEDSVDIWERCVKKYPQLTGAKVMKTMAGLRPYRPQVRLELDHVTSHSGHNVPVIHNYGHGGSGVTLFKGCAENIVEIMMSLPECALVRTHPSKL